MNLFENLQIMTESENKIISEFKEFLISKNAQYIANEIGETKDGMQIVIYDGDWKHEHLYMKHLLDEFFTSKGIDISITSEEIGESNQDTYSARYDVEFNIEPKEYIADVVTEDVDTSNWKQRFKGMDIYISDKYPDYQIKKSYTSSKQEVWQVLNFKTQREVFASGTFEGAIQWIENKSTSKQIEVMRERGYLGVKDESSQFDTTIAVEYTYDGDEVSDYKGNINVRTDDEEVALSVAEKYIKSTHPEINPRNFLISPNVYSNVTTIDVNGKKLTESNEEDNDNAATFLDKLETDVKEAAHKFMLSVGFPEDEADDYLSVSTDINDDYVMVAVGAELGYESLSNLCDELNKVIEKHDKDAYFEPECPGRIVAYLFGIKEESLNKIEETNHNIIEDRDYATGEKLFNALKDYLDSLDQIDMNGEDYNWQPSEFNAKNLNADGEIYLVSGAYILIYPYINEWAEDYFKVTVVEADDLSVQIRNGIENIFNKFKSNNWKLIFEG